MLVRVGQLLTGNNGNTENDMNFLCNAPLLIDFLLAKLLELP